MKLFSFQIHQQRKVGAELEGQLVDLSSGYAAWLAAYGPKDGALRSLPSDMLSFIRLGKLALDAARETLSYFAKRPALPVGEEVVHPFEAVHLLGSVPRPGKIVCAVQPREGRENSGIDSAGRPRFFAKFPSSVIGPGGEIVKSRHAEKIEPGAVLGVVIGKKCKDVTEETALKSVFGFTILNDITAHGPAFDGNDLSLAKNFDTFCPLGPCIVTPEDLPEPGNLNLRVWVNGTLSEDHSLSDSMFSVAKLISVLSEVMTLEPGDIVGTGAHPGELRACRPGLVPGDEVRVEIEGIGRLDNRVVAALPG